MTLLVTSLAWSSEDFSTFTELDPGSNITVTSSLITTTALERQGTASIYKSYGASYFANFTHQFTLEVTSAETYSDAGFWALSNFAAPTIADINTTNQGYFAKVEAEPFGCIRFYLSNTALDSVDSTPNLGCEFGYASGPIYITIQKNATDLSMKLYRDSGRTDLYDTLIVSRNTTTFKYLAATLASENGGSGDKDLSFKVSNLTITDDGGGSDSPPLNESSNHLIFR